MNRPTHSNAYTTWFQAHPKYKRQFYTYLTQILHLNVTEENIVQYIDRIEAWMNSPQHQDARNSWNEWNAKDAETNALNWEFLRRNDNPTSLAARTQRIKEQARTLFDTTFFQWVLKDNDVGTEEQRRRLTWFYEGLTRSVPTANSVPLKVKF